MSSTNDPYKIALFVLQKISCTFSALGSLMIISQVSRSQFNRKRTQQRLMLGISIIDLNTSIVWIFTNLFMPPESGALFATGNQASCDAQGFLVQFSTAGFLYMCALQLQYLLVIKYGWKERRMAKVEKWFHLMPIMFGLATATAALVLKQYNPADWDCWIAPLPANCTSSFQANKGSTELPLIDCDRGDNAEFYRWAFFFGPLWVSIMFCITVMVLVYQSVRNTEKRASRWNIRRSINFPYRSNSQRMILRSDKNRKKDDKKEEGGNITCEVKKQSYMYAGAFFIVWTFPTIARIIQLFGGKVHPTLIVLSGTFIGSQGMWNALTYFRPRYNKCVKYDKWYKKVWSLVRATLFFCCHDGDYTNDKKDYLTSADGTPGIRPTVRRPTQQNCAVKPEAANDEFVKSSNSDLNRVGENEEKREEENEYGCSRDGNRIEEDEEKQEERGQEE